MPNMAVSCIQLPLKGRVKELKTASYRHRCCTEAQYEINQDYFELRLMQSSSNQAHR